MTTFLPQESSPAAGSQPFVRAKPLGLFDVLAYVFPLLVFAQFHVVGWLYLAEIAIAGSLPLIVYGAQMERRLRVPVLPFVLGCLWLFSQVETDVYRGSSFVDYSRGWAKVAFTVVNFVGLWLVIDQRPRRIALAGAGLASGLILEYFVEPNQFAAGDPWKFGVGLPITLLVVLFVTRRAPASRSFIPALVLAALAVLNLTLSYRSLAGICFLACTYALANRLFASRGTLRLGWEPFRIAVYCAGAVAATFAFVSIYGQAASGGWLGTKAQAEYRRQSAGGLLINGRPDVFIAATAIRDSPLIGHGSWAKDAKYAQMLTDYSFRNAGRSVTSDVIPTHSLILGAWVEGGILAAIFWAWALVLALRVLVRLYRTRRRDVVFVAFVALLLLWDILFSPYGAERRLIEPYYLVVLLSALRSEIRRPAAGVGGL